MFSWSTIEIEEVVVDDVHAKRRSAEPRPRRSGGFAQRGDGTGLLLDGREVHANAVANDQPLRRGEPEHARPRAGIDGLVKNCPHAFLCSSSVCSRYDAASISCWLSARSFVGRRANELPRRTE